ncbi:histidine--tRNA ligase, cytoplasmic [Prosopis cineraria]|uniref:histidine--tRNA ligase, cytoplasmic n=1 Tax=Prosopis cineraria TaxID=364024 RepID=UPI00240EC5B5|nr:histidine--tRNA ligase, cytoplasmic [Prosopis cineraria]
MAERGEISVLTLGGKGSSLSSSSLYAIASGRALLRIDSAALDRLSSSKRPPPPSCRCRIFFPDFLTPEDRRAFLVVLLNNLLLSNAPGIRVFLPELIAEALNSKPQSLEFGEVDVTEDEMLVLKNSFSPLLGVSSILDHQAAALSAFADFAAALSCEALKADITAFDLMDSGDGHASKEKVGVSSDMKVLLNGSKLVGKVKIESVSRIPVVHGTMREQVKLVHSKMRVELNSGVGTEGAVSVVLLALAAALGDLGEWSFLRAENNLASIASNELRSSLEGVSAKRCPTFSSLGSRCGRAFDLYLKKDFGNFVHEVKMLLDTVWNIVAWEVVTAFVALESVELTGKIQEPAGKIQAGVNRDNTKVEKKNEKKKVVLGKGNSVILQLIKDRLQNKRDDAVDMSGLLEIWVCDFLSLFDLKDPEFEVFLSKVKDFIESNESRRLPKIPKGTRDFAKEQMTVRKKAFSIIEEVFERHGAAALDTPVFELRETLTGKYGEDSKLIYDLADQGGELCSLRYDLTVPFARYVAMNGLTSFKRYQIAKVYRRDNPSKGRYREFYQCDFDIAGQFEKMGPDFEVVRILTELLDELDIGDYEIKLNHRKLLDGMMEICGVPAAKFRTICSSIDKLDKQSFDQIRREMVEEKGISAETADKIGAFVNERGPPLALLSKFKQEGSSFLEHAGSVDALNDLEILFRALDKSKRIGKIVFDLSLARGLDYYTGVIFEAVFKGSTQVGSIAAGGRYDNLIGMFGSKQVPAIGVSLGIERVFAIMEQLQKDRNQMPRASKTEVLVSILGDDLTLASELVSELWDVGIKAEFLVNKRPMKHIDRARESRIPWMVLVGERELNKGVVNLKDVEAAKEMEIPRDQIVEELQRRLNP